MILGSLRWDRGGTDEGQGLLSSIAWEITWFQRLSFFLRFQPPIPCPDA